MTERRLPGIALRVLLVAVPGAFLGYFFLYPLTAIIVTGLAPEGSFDPAPFAEVVRSPSLRNVAWFTVWQAVASTLLTLLVGLPAAYVFARYRFPGKALFRAAVTIPFVLPTVVVGTAFLALLGPDGPLGIDLRRTVWAILIAHVFYNFAVIVRTVGSFWERIDPRLEQAAMVLGATRWQAFRRVTLPLLRPALASAASIVFLFTFTSFGVILILGGFRNATLEVEIWRRAVNLGDFPVAAALAVLQLLAVGTLLFLYARYQDRRAVQLRVATGTARPPRAWWERMWVAAVVGGSGLLLGTPLLNLVVRSVRVGDGFGLDNYLELGTNPRGSVLFVPPATAVWNSLRFAIVATLIAVAVGLMAAVVIAYGRGWTSRLFDALLMLPLGTSAVTIGFGFLVALDEPVDLRSSIWLIPIAHALIAVPFVVRTTVPVMRAVSRRLREAAMVLGASPTRAWREIDLPIVSRAAAVGAGFAFAVSIGEFGATSFIARPEAPTIPIAIFRFLGQPGATNLGRAMALATILMAITAAAILLIDRLRGDTATDF